MLKNKLKNSKDQNYEVHEASIFSTADQKAKETFQDKYFYQEYRGVFKISSLLLVVANFSSFITGVIAVQLATKLLIGFYLSAIVAIIVCACLEVLKAFLWRIGAKKYLKYKERSKLILSALIGLHLVSLLFSAYGGWMLPTLVDAPKMAEVAPINKDSISEPFLFNLQRFDSQVDSLNSKIKNTKSNSTVRTLSVNVGVLLSQRKQEKKALDLAILEAKEKRQAKVQKNLKGFLDAKIERNEEIKIARLSCLAASVGFELLFIACSCFCTYYLYRLNIDLEYEEKEESDPESRTNQPTPNTGNSSLFKQGDHKAPRVAPIQKIGFQQGSCLDGKKNVLDAKSSPCLDGKVKNDASGRLDGVRACALSSCQRTFVGGPKNKKFCSAECRKMAYQNRRYLAKSKS